MKGQTVLSVCIADMNDLLEMSLRDHVLKGGEMCVKEVVWIERDMEFRIVLEPRKSEG